MHHGRDTRFIPPIDAPREPGHDAMDHFFVAFTCSQHEWRVAVIVLGDPIALVLLFLDKVLYYFKMPLLGSYVQGSVASYVWVVERPRVVLEDPLGSGSCQ